MSAPSAESIAPAAAYEKHLAEGRLTYQRCGDCQRAIFYPRLACPQCGSQALAWNVSAGAGAVYSMSAIPGRDGPDHIVCLVDLDEGFRMMSTIATDSPSDVSIGSRVRAKIQPADAEGGKARVVFVVAKAGASQNG